MTAWLPRLIARLPASVHTKLLVAFLIIAALLVAVGAVGLGVLGEANRRAEELVQLHRKTAAYRQLQHDTTAQLYSVASIFSLPLEQIDARMIEAALRQLKQFGYDLDRLQYVAKDEVELLGRIQEEYNRFIQVMSEAITMIAAGGGRRGPGTATHAGHASGRPPRAPHQRAGEQSRGRDGGESREQPRRRT